MEIEWEDAIAILQATARSIDTDNASHPADYGRGFSQGIRLALRLFGKDN